MRERGSVSQNRAPTSANQPLPTQVQGSKGDQGWKVRFDKEIQEMNQEEGQQRKSALRRTSPSPSQPLPSKVIEVDSEGKRSSTPESVPSEPSQSHQDQPTREVSMTKGHEKGKSKSKPARRKWLQKGKGGKGKGKMKSRAGTAQG